MIAPATNSRAFWGRSDSISRLQSLSLTPLYARAVVRSPYACCGPYTTERHSRRPSEPGAALFCLSEVRRLDRIRSRSACRSPGLRSISTIRSTVGSSVRVSDDTPTLTDSVELRDHTLEARSAWRASNSTLSSAAVPSSSRDMHMLVVPRRPTGSAMLPVGNDSHIETVGRLGRGARYASIPLPTSNVSIGGICSSAGARGSGLL